MRTLGAALALGTIFATPAWSQASMRPCLPPEERIDAPGPACFTAKATVGHLPDTPLYWHLETYANKADAEAARGPRGTVVESLDKIWLFTLEKQSWHPPRGKPAGSHMAMVGPIPISSGVDYEAVYMESIFAPGQTAPLHAHSGAEAFYTLTGDTCLETPAGVQWGIGPGNVVIVPGGLPMLLVARGTEQRRGVVLILHDSTQPPTTLTDSWTPKGLCSLAAASAKP